MGKFLTATVVALVLAFSGVAGAKPESNYSPSVFKSVHMLGGKNPADGKFFGFCTAWSTYNVDNTVVWMSAGHCALDNNGEFDFNYEYFIDGKQVWLVKGVIDLDTGARDFAMFTGGPSVKPLRVSYAPPRMGQSVFYVGYPGVTVQHVFMGIVSAEAEADGLWTYQLPVLGGSSGSPILDMDGMVVGIITQTKCHNRDWCVVSRAPSLKELRKFIYGE